MSLPPPSASAAPVEKKKRPREPKALKVKEPAVKKIKPADQPLIKEEPVGCPPGVDSVLKQNGKLELKRTKHPPKAEQPEGDHPSQEEPISSQEFDRHHNEDPPKYILDTSSDEEEEHISDTSSDENVESSDEEEEEEEEEMSEDTDPIQRLRFPSTSMINAKQFGGKSNVAHQILEKRADEFDEIIVVGRSAAVDKYLGEYATSPNHRLKDMSEKFLVEYQEYREKTPGKTLWLMDDASGMLFNMYASPAFKQLIKTGRNNGHSFIHMDQCFKSVPPFLRDNANYYFVGNHWERNIEAAAEQLGGATMSRQEVKKALWEVARHNRRDHKEFLFVDNEDQLYKTWTPECTIK